MSILLIKPDSKSYMQNWHCFENFFEEILNATVIGMKTKSKRIKTPNNQIETWIETWNNRIETRIIRIETRIEKENSK